MLATANSVADRRRNPLRPWIWSLAALALAVPAVAMRFTAQVDWGAGDFVAMGALLLTACLLYELAARLSASRAYRAGAGIAVANGVLTVWVNLAVGMLGNEGNPVNLLFGGVLLIAAVGSLLARFRPRGMAVAMAVTATAQVLVVAVGIGVGLATATQGAQASGVAGDAMLAACVALPWLIAAALFRNAAGQARH